MYWIITLILFGVVGGGVFWINGLRTRKENYPLPKSKVETGRYSKHQGPPLLIRLPKLG